MILTTSAASALFLASALAAPPPDLDATDGPPPAEIKTVELILSPKAAPREVFRLRLLPRATERTPGDAVPIYLRLGAVQKDDRIGLIDEKAAAYLDGPLSDLPVAEVRKLVDSWAGQLQQMEYAARRRTADWNYTLPEQRDDAYNILLPDMQEMRTWGRLLAMKARVEIAEKRYDDAARTIETGLSMARQVAEGPTVINGLVGIAMASVFLNRVEELIAQPDAPNFYWPLTALPRPLVNMRDEIETEQVIGHYLLPDMNGTNAPRTDAEVSALLARLHARWVVLAKLSAHEGGKDSPSIEPDLAKFRAATLPEAKAFFKERGTSTDGMSDDRTILTFLGADFRETRDAAFKPYYLPYPEAAAYYKEAREGAERKTAAKGSKSSIVQLILPTVDHVHLAEVRLDRRVAALRVIEALRLQAAADRGEFPDSLDAIKLVPVPNDPLTGKSFGFRRDGDARVLSAPALSDRAPALSYKITARK
jgi:hypothetical protein